MHQQVERARTDTKVYSMSSSSLRHLQGTRKSIRQPGSNIQVSGINRYARTAFSSRI